MTGWWAWAMSFPMWTCREDGQHVEWEDAHFELEDGRLVAVLHESCVGVGGNQ